jgi:hypothetical protein
MIQLAQNQLWKTDSAEATEGTLHDVTKKEFCRLIKGAELIES